MNDILKIFIKLMTYNNLNYNNIKQVSLLINSTVDELPRVLIIRKIVDYNEAEIKIKDFMQSVQNNEVIKGWVSFDNYSWIERDEANGFDINYCIESFWQYKFYPILPEEVKE